MINSQVYSEVYEILKHMNKEVVMKIPMEMLDNIKNKRDLNYRNQIDKADIFNPDNVLPETIEILNWIDVNFWMSQDKKEKLLKVVRKKELEEEKIKKQKYNPNAIFSKNVRVDLKQEQTEKMIPLLIENKKENFFKKLIKNTKKILHID